MLEIPESATLARQINETVRGKTIKHVVANAAPHKLAWYCGDPAAYGALLTGRAITGSRGIGAMLEIEAEDGRIVLGDGANLRYYASREEAPDKHQLLVELDDGGALVCAVQMYGAVLAFKEGTYQDKYYVGAKSKPQPITDAFDRAYFASLYIGGAEKLSAKAFLATEQRIPGLGNGTLQDILFAAGVHPKRKMGTLPPDGMDRLYGAVRDVLSAMTDLGGRDTEKDLFGNPGGYVTKLSRNTVGKPCPVCGETIEKGPYMGGAVYWCPRCQPES